MRKGWWKTQKLTGAMPRIGAGRCFYLTSQREHTNPIGKPIHIHAQFKGI